MRALCWGGRYLTVGYASGDIPKVGMNRLLVSGGALHGVLWGAWAKRNPEHNAANMRRLFDWYDRGALRPHVSETYPLADAAAALDVVMGRRARGRRSQEWEELTDGPAAEPPAKPGTSSAARGVQKRHDRR
ncbi:zinc-binding dehydrogenase, partial [Prescottella equi]|uniref:zinc-binding dehydrogenase n=1 Tax=Rhodococcus hoagii TaxID=43767 RepID=UPI000AE46314